MDQRDEWATIVRLVDQLRAAGSWCGETHIQKAAFFLKHLRSVPLCSEFVLYKHGPFSFELREGINFLTAAGQLSLEAQEPPYGPRYNAAPAGREFVQRVDSLNPYGNQIADIAERLAVKNVSELERVATALWFKLQAPAAAKHELALSIHEVKPHVSVEAGLVAVDELQAMTV